MSNTPLRIGVIGLGRAFTLMLPTFLADKRVQLVAACDPREAARAQFQRDFAAPAFFGATELLAQADVQAVYIASPHQFHAEHTLAAAAAGKHVLVEKPMALSIAECTAMIAACDQHGVQLVVGHSHSFDAPYQRTRDLIDSGEFGRVRMIQALNHTDYLYRARRPEELCSATGGGANISQAAHQIDIVRWLAGSTATHLRASMGLWDDARPTEGAYSAMLWFEDGVVANLSYSGYGHFDSDEWCGWIGELGSAKDPTAHGAARRKLSGVGTSLEEAQMKADATYGGPAWKPAAPVSADAPAPAHQHFGPVLVSCERGVLRPLPDAVWAYGDKHKTRHALTLPTVPRQEVIDELVAAVSGGRPPPHNGRWARATLEICLALRQSSQEGRDVALHFQHMA